MTPTDANISVIRPGDRKAQPFTIVVVANPVLEIPFDSGNFIIDPILADQASFKACVQYIDDALFGNLPNQQERWFADPTLGPKVRLVSLFAPGLPNEESNSLVGEFADILDPRQHVFRAFLNRYHLEADVVYAVSKSAQSTRSSSWFTSDDDTRSGVPFTLDGKRLYHRFYNFEPGSVAIHASANSLTALHELGHALSSYTNGQIVDLYVDSDDEEPLNAVNRKRGRPIPGQFCLYNGTAYQSDMLRDHLGYPPHWTSYHCQLFDSAHPSVMDDFWQSQPVPELCQHDLITRQFLLDRVRAKMSR